MSCYPRILNGVSLLTYLKFIDLDPTNSSLCVINCLFNSLKFPFIIAHVKMNWNVFETKCNVDFLYFLQMLNVNALLLQLFPHQTYHFNWIGHPCNEAKTSASEYIQLPEPVA